MIYVSVLELERVRALYHAAGQRCMVDDYSLLEEEVCSLVLSQP